MTDKMDRFYKNLEEVFTARLLERMPHDMMQTLIKLYVVENQLPSSVLILAMEALDLENDSVQMAFADLQLRVKKLSPMKVVPAERVA